MQHKDELPQPTGIENEPYFDVCILCALVDEAEMLKKAFASQDNVKFQRTWSPRIKREYDYAMIGNVDGETLRVLVSWLPNYGPVKKVKLGDIIVAERAFLYDTGKVVQAEDGRSEFLRDTQMWSTPVEVIHFVRGFSTWKQAVVHEKRPFSKHQQRDWLLNKLLNPQTLRVDDIPMQELEEHVPDWRSIVRELRKGPDAYLTSERMLKDQSRVYELRYGDEIFPFKDPKQPNVHIAPIASGSAVRSDDPFKEIRVPVRGTLAVDMEGATFYRTLAEFSNIHFLLVKGVSDYADSDKDDSYRQYASRVAALYMLSFIREYVTSSRLPELQREQAQESTREVKAQVNAPLDRGVQSAHPDSVSQAQSGKQASTKAQQSGLNLFYSYAPTDELLRRELEKHLVMLRRQGWIEQWSAHDVGGGQPLEEVKTLLNQAQIILLLISPDFLASPLYENELEPALKMQEEGRARVIPILLRMTGGWEETPLGKLVVLPRNNKPVAEWSSRDAAFTEVAREIRGVIKNLRDTGLVRSPVSDQSSSPISAAKSYPDKGPSSLTQAPSAPKTLSFAEKTELVNKLLGCSSIRDRDSRETVLRQLNDQFPGTVNAVSRRTDNRADVMEIVLTCLNHPGSLQELVSIVTFFEGESSVNTQLLRTFMQSKSIY
jgi:nucleoside phosphorylase